MKHDDGSDNVAPDLISPVSSGSAKSIYKDRPQSPGSSPQLTMKCGPQPQTTQLRNPNLQPQYSNQVYNQTVNQFPQQNIVPNAHMRPGSNLTTSKCVLGVSVRAFQEPTTYRLRSWCRRFQPYPTSRQITSRGPKAQGTRRRFRLNNWSNRRHDHPLLEPH